MSFLVLKRFGPFLPGWSEVLQVGPLALVYVGMVSQWAGWLRCSKSLPVAYTRKIFHFAIIPVAGVVQVGWGLGGTVVFGFITVLFVFHALWRGSGNPFYEALARNSDRPQRALFVVVPMVMTGLGGVLSNVFFGSMATVGYWVCGVGDAVAEPVGRRWGDHRYQVPSLAGVSATRSLEGSAAVFVMGWVAASLSLFSLGYKVGPDLLGVALVCSVASTVAEAFSHHGTDNLTLQVVAAGTAFWWAG